MGQWGLYDDEGDLVADYAIDIERRVLPKHLQRCYKYDKIVNVPCSKLKNKKALNKVLAEIRKEIGTGDGKDISTWESGRKCEIHARTDKAIKCYLDGNRYMQEHPEQVYSELLKLVKKFDSPYTKSHVIAGIANYLARGWHSTPIFPNEFGALDRGFKFPAKLPANFPPQLRKLAYKASAELLLNFDNHLQWREPERRIEALKNQIKFYKK